MYKSHFLLSKLRVKNRLFTRQKSFYLRVAMGKDYPGIQRLKKDGLNWHQYWTQLRTYLRGEGLLHII